MAGALPSTFHQKVKFLAEENLITVAVEEDMVATTTVSTPYVKVGEDTTECSLRSFKVATVICTRDGLEMPASHLS